MQVGDDELYVTSEGDAEVESEDQIVTDELLDDDDDAGGDVVIKQENGDDDDDIGGDVVVKQEIGDDTNDNDYAGGDVVVKQEIGDDTIAEASVEDQEQQKANEKTSCKRSRSMSPAATHEKDDFDDDELDSDVDLTGRMDC